MPQSGTSRHHTSRQVLGWLSRPAWTTTPDASLSNALALMHAHHVRHLPVIDDAGDVCGIITESDIRGAMIVEITGLDLAAIATMLNRIAVRDVMTEEPITIAPDATLREAALLMLDNKIGGLPVTESDHGLVGMITESDLFKALASFLEPVDSDE
jgi:CBS domain-containing protein